MNDIEKYYDILGLKPGATEAEIKQAYKDLIFIWHPDRLGDNPRRQKQGEEKTKEINAAYREIAKHLKEHEANKSSEQNTGSQQERTGEEKNKRHYNSYSDESSKKKDGGLYNVIFNGETLPGFNDLEVKQGLCDWLKIAPSSLKGKWIFGNKTVIMKAGIDIQYAERCKALMAEIGAVGVIASVVKGSGEQGSYKSSNGNGTQEPREDKAQDQGGANSKFKKIIPTMPTIIATAIVVLVIISLVNLSKDAKGYLKSGNEWKKKGDYNRAIADYTKAIEINPRDAIAYNNRGIVWGEKGNYDMAIDDFIKAIEIAPQNGMFFFNLGVSYNKQGWPFLAITDFKIAARLGDKAAQDMLWSEGITW
ncbi:MAG: tetratricopeptide repeat protein [Nitrospirae bacterium]|nr:tetratricopeptide repeat protein [Nitrospirota bacterium]